MMKYAYEYHVNVYGLVLLRTTTRNVPFLFTLSVLMISYHTSQCECNKSVTVENYEHCIRTYDKYEKYAYSCLQSV